MKHDYSKLDAAILALVTERGPIPERCIDRPRTAVRDAVNEAPEAVQWNVVRYRLQALRKRGAIRYSSKPEGWVIAAPSTQEGK